MTDNELPKLPAIQFYPSDWINDLRVQNLSWHDKAVWFELLLIMHVSEKRGMLMLNGKKMTHAYLANQLGMRLHTFKRTINNIIQSGVAYVDNNGVIYNKRMVNDNGLRAMRAAAGAKGGNPVLVNQKQPAAQPVVSAQVAATAKANNTTGKNTTTKVNTERVQQLRQLTTENNDWLQQTSNHTKISLLLVRYYCDDWITNAALRHLTDKHSTDVLIGFMLKDLDKKKPTLLPAPPKEESIHDRWY